VRLRAIADEIGAFPLADIFHIASLVAADVLPSPVNVAHVTTVSMYKQLRGLILLGEESGQGGASRTSLLDRGVFPVSLDIVRQAEFRATAVRMARDASALASVMIRRGYRVLTGGTDNHMVMVTGSKVTLAGRCCSRHRRRPEHAIRRRDKPVVEQRKLSPHLRSQQG
jgi:glycine hydroxymethyltransferase